MCEVSPTAICGSIWSLSSPLPSWERRFILLFLILVILLATPETVTTTLTLTHLATAALDAAARSLSHH